MLFLLASLNRHTLLRRQASAFSLTSWCNRRFDGARCVIRWIQHYRIKSSDKCFFFILLFLLFLSALGKCHCFAGRQINISDCFFLLFLFRQALLLLFTTATVFFFKSPSFFPLFFVCGKPLLLLLGSKSPDCFQLKCVEWVQVFSFSLY